MKIEEKLSQMIQIETVSEIGKDNEEKFERFQAKLKELFPLYSARWNSTLSMVRFFSGGRGRTAQSVLWY